MEQFLETVKDQQLQTYVQLYHRLIYGIHSLKIHRLVDFLLAYDSHSSVDQGKDAQNLDGISHFLPVLVQVETAVQQLHCSIKQLLIDLSLKIQADRNVKLTLAVKYVMEWMSLLKSIELAISGNDCLRADFAAYKKLVMQKSENVPLMQKFVEMERIVFAVNQLEMIGNQMQEQATLATPEMPIYQFMASQKTFDYLIDCCGIVLSAVVQSKTQFTLNGTESSRLVGALMLIELLWNLFPTHKMKDKKLVKLLAELAGHFSYLSVGGAGQYVQARQMILPAIYKGLQPAGLLLDQQTVKLSTALMQIASEWHDRVSVWRLRMQYRLSANHTPQSYLNAYMKLFKQGSQYSDSISRLCWDFVTLHRLGNYAVDMEDVVPLCKLMTLVLEIQSGFRECRADLNRIVPLLYKHSALNVIVILLPLKQLLENQTDTTKGLVYLDLVHIALTVFHNQPSDQSLVLLKLAVDRLMQYKGLDDSQVAKLRIAVAEFEFLQQLLDEVDCMSDLSTILLQNRALISVFLEQVGKDAALTEILPKFTALLNCSYYLINTHQQHVDAQQVMIVNKQFSDDVMADWELMMTMICHGVETDLRLQTHKNRQVDGRDPFSMHSLDYRVYMEIPVMVLFGKQISIKHCVEQYLKKSFYNVNAKAPLDTEHYLKMRLLAKQQYHLDLLNSDCLLPEVGLDENNDLMKLFASQKLSALINGEWSYNMHNCSFQHKSESLTLQFMHIQNTLRIHGHGIVNSIINGLYQFIVQKFTALESVLGREMVKSTLLKSHANFQHNLQHRFFFQQVKFDAQKIADHVREAKELVMSIGVCVALITSLQEASKQNQLLDAWMEPLKQFAVQSESFNLFYLLLPILQFYQTNLQMASTEQQSDSFQQKSMDEFGIGCCCLIEAGNMWNSWQSLNWIESVQLTVNKSSLMPELKSEVQQSPVKRSPSKLVKFRLKSKKPTADELLNHAINEMDKTFDEHSQNFESILMIYKSILRSDRESD